jgi:hypothetical protein
MVLSQLILIKLRLACSLVLWLTCLVLPSNGFLVPVWWLIAQPQLIHRSIVCIVAGRKA